MQSLNKEGYAVIGLDAKDYFWNKKRPQEAATASEEVLNGSNKEWKKKNIVLIGYSFGADVSPFMLTHFDSPALMISNDVSHTEMGISAHRAMLTMVTQAGSVWMLENVDK